jgi:hypothetical protein
MIAVVDFLHLTCSPFTRSGEAVFKKPVSGSKMPMRHSDYPRGGTNVAILEGLEDCL